MLIRPSALNNRDNDLIDDIQKYWHELSVIFCGRLEYWSTTTIKVLSNHLVFTVFFIIMGIGSYAFFFMLFHKSLDTRNLLLDLILLVNSRPELMNSSNTYFQSMPTPVDAIYHTLYRSSKLPKAATATKFPLLMSQHTALL